MAQIDRSVVNFENLDDKSSGFTANNSNVLGKGKSNRGPSLNVKKGGKGPSAKVSKATKTSGKFGKKSEGHAQGKGANGKIR
jgi:hypothetical protein